MRITDYSPLSSDIIESIEKEAWGLSGSPRSDISSPPGWVHVPSRAPLVRSWSKNHAPTWKDIPAADNNILLFYDRVTSGYFAGTKKGTDLLQVPEGTNPTASPQEAVAQYYRLLGYKDMSVDQFGHQHSKSELEEAQKQKEKEKKEQSEAEKTEDKQQSSINDILGNYVNPDNSLFQQMPLTEQQSLDGALQAGFDKSSIDLVACIKRATQRQLLHARAGYNVKWQEQKVKQESQQLLDIAGELNNPEIPKFEVFNKLKQHVLANPATLSYLLPLNSEAVTKTTFLSRVIADPSKAIGLLDDLKGFSKNNYNRIAATGFDESKKALESLFATKEPANEKRKRTQFALDSASKYAHGLEQQLADLYQVTIEKPDPASEPKPQEKPNTGSPSNDMRQNLNFY